MSYKKLINNETKELITNKFLVWKMMKDISIIDLNKDMTITELSKEIRVSRSHPYFNGLVSFLINKEVISISKIKGTNKYIKIDKVKLKSCIESTEIWKQYVDYITNNKLTEEII
jgi:hypothetical protein